MISQGEVDDILSQTALVKLVQKYGYSSLRQLGKIIDELKPRKKNGGKVRNTYTSLLKACKGENALSELNKKYVMQVLGCSRRELELALAQCRRGYLESQNLKGNLDDKYIKELECLNLYIASCIDKATPAPTTHNDAEVASSPKTIPPPTKHDSGLSSCISLEGGFNNVLYDHICEQGDNINKNFLKTPSISLNSKNSNYSRSKELIVPQSSPAIHPGQNKIEGVNGNILDLNGEVQCDFKVLSLQVKACYYENRSFRWRKIYRILFLKDGVEKIKNLDFFEVKGEPVQKFYQKDEFLLVPKTGIMTTSDVLTVKLHKPSRIGQMLDIVIDFFCPKLYGSDNTFGATLLRFPIPWLGLDIAPPYPGINKITEVLQFSNLEDYRRLREPKNLGRLLLNPFTNSFQIVISNLRASLLVLPWERCAA